MKNVLCLPVALLFACLFALPVAAQDTWLGLRLEVVERADAQKLGIDGGLKVTRVDDHSPAKEAGFEVGDVILSTGEATITTIEALRDIIDKRRPGDVLSFGVRRANGRNEPLMVTLGSTADRDNKFRDDPKVVELNERLRELDAERRRVREQLDKRLEELRKGGTSTPQPQPQPTPEPPKIESTPRDPDRVEIKVNMGASFVNLEPSEAREKGLEAGVRVKSVSSGGASDEAGLKVGDVVLRADGSALAGTGELRLLLSEKKAGDRLELEVMRDGKKVTITIVLRQK